LRAAAIITLSSADLSMPSGLPAARTGVKSGRVR
jgi:hypothetical protein